MALKTLENLEQVNGHKLIIMDALREKYPEKFNESGSMDYKWFEKEIRPHNFIYVRHDKNSLSFTFQNGPVGEVGVNGCQVTDALAVLKHMYEELNKNFYCHENDMTIAKLDEAIKWQNHRTQNREARGVEGFSKQ